jgi:hypothetical protein
MNKDAVDYTMGLEPQVLAVYNVASLTTDLYIRQTDQQLMDQLWALGFRPTGEQPVDILAVFKSYLNDMRRIVSKQLKVEMPDVP